MVEESHPPPRNLRHVTSLEKGLLRNAITPPVLISEKSEAQAGPSTWRDGWSPIARDYHTTEQGLAPQRTSKSKGSDRGKGPPSKFDIKFTKFMWILLSMSFYCWLVLIFFKITYHN